MGCGTNSVTFGNTILTYVPVATLNVTAPSNVDMGYFTTSCVGGGTSCTYNALPTGLNLFLEINQTSPSAGTATFSSATVSGSISGNSSWAFVNWGSLASASINAGGLTTTYSLLNNPLAIVPPNSNNCITCPIQPSGLTTIQAEVTQSAPEPGAYLLLSTGLIGIYASRKRK
jgi:hypothetical protein